MRWSKMIPVAILGVLAVAYLLVGPGLAPLVPHLAILEFPISVLVVGLLLWMALRRRPAERPPPAPEHRKHAQVVRAVPDPETARLAASLDAWVEKGEDAPQAAEALARAQTRDPEERQRLVADLRSKLASLTTRKQRAAFLQDLEKNPGA